MVKRTLLNSWGELTSQGVAVCVEKMLDGKMNELPKWLIKHLEQSSDCRSRVSFLLEHEKEHITNEVIRANIDANTSVPRTKQGTPCNNSLQIVTPLKNNVCIGTIWLQFEQPFQKHTQLCIHDHTDKRVFNVEIPPDSIIYQFTPQNIGTDIYYYIVAVQAATIFNYFYYCTRKDEKRMMVGANISYSL